MSESTDIDLLHEGSRVRDAYGEAVVRTPAAVRARGDRDLDAPPS